MTQETLINAPQEQQGLLREGRRISVVIPALNEAASLPELIRRLDRLAAEKNYRMQVVLVDDGSTDNTHEVVATCEPTFIESLVYIRFRMNLGKSVALSEGVDRAEAEIIVTMDADLQDQPEEIPNLVKRIDEGCDVVSGWKKRRNDPFFRKKLPSHVFNWLVRKILRSSLKDINCGLKVYRKEVWDEIRVYGEFHRFIPALAANRGFRIGEIEVEHRPRTQGTSKYGASRFVKGVLDLLTVYFLNAYRHRPLHFFGVLGGFLGALGFLGGAYLTVLWLLGQTIGSRPLLLLSALLLIIGVQVVLFGLLSQLQIDLFHKTSRDRPHAAILRRDFKRGTAI
jgi:glycosyltransferase involved in cell wall biosynthesis